jgi:lysozyme
MERNIQIGDGSVPDRWQQREGSSEIPEEIQDVDQAGLEFIAQEEGLSLKPYRDSVGIPTVGIGSTYYPQTGKRVTMQDPPITKEFAFKMFKDHLNIYEKGVWSVTRDDISQSQFNALVSLCFNIGIAAFKGSTVLRRVNADPNDPDITQAFLMWKNAGNKPVLLARRKRESALYFS